MGQHSHLYNLAAWKRKRRMQLSNNPMCVMCLALGRFTPATVADHVIPHQGNRESFLDGQLQSLCKQHHDGAKQAEEKSGKIRGSDLTGNPIDPNHHWNKM